MTRQVVSGAALVLVLAATAGAGGELFEDALVVKVAKGPHGPRGMPGDIVSLKDGSLLMSYTQDGVGIMGIKSPDRGKTWDDPLVLISMPKPPAKGYYAHPGFLRLSNGEILLSYIYSTHPATRATWACRSSPTTSAIVGRRARTRSTCTGTASGSRSRRPMPWSSKTAA